MGISVKLITVLNFPQFTLPKFMHFQDCRGALTEFYLLLTYNRCQTQKSWNECKILNDKFFLGGAITAGLYIASS